MANAFVEQLVDLYRKYSKILTPISGIVTKKSPETINVKINYSQRDLERSETVKAAETFVVNASSLKAITTTSAFDVFTEVLRCSTVSGNQDCILRIVKDGKGEEKQFLEVWSGAKKTLNIDLHQREIHGKVNADDQFGCLQWSQDEKQILYVAEQKQPITESFLKMKLKTEKPDATECAYGNKYLYLEDWGETLVGKRQPIPFILNVESETIAKAVPDLPEDVSFGQAIWTPNSKDIVCVGWLHEPRRLGLVFCTNRMSAIYHLLTKENKCEIIGDSSKSVMSPRFSPDGKKLIYFEREVMGPHHKGARLILCHWPSKETEVIVDLINSSPADDFPGLYLNSIPKQIWTNNSNYLIFSTVWKSREELICVNINSKSVHKLSDDTHSCWKLFDISNNIMLVTVSSPDKEPFCVLGRFPDHFIPMETQIDWIPLSLEKSIPNIEWEIIDFKPREEFVNKDYPNLDYQAIVIRSTQPSISKESGLIVWPHGGPHSTYVACFNFYASLFAEIGYTILLINYRGSPGNGEDNIYSLLGNIGSHDVSDCQQAAEHVKLRYNIKTVYVFGGSHGGFLSAHLIGQHPDFYAACTCRNPVIDFASQLAVSDIPDWAWVESGLLYSPESVALPEDSRKMWEKSPLKYVDKIKTPVLLLVGKEDLRVPPSQSLFFYHALKARNVSVKMLMYDDNHSLSKVDVEFDGFINTVLWFMNFKGNNV